MDLKLFDGGAAGGVETVKSDRLVSSRRMVVVVDDDDDGEIQEDEMEAMNGLDGSHNGDSNNTEMFGDEDMGTAEEPSFNVRLIDAVKNSR